MRNCLESSAAKGSAAKSLALTRRCSPLAVSVTTITGRRAARSALSSLSVASFTYLPNLLNKHADCAAAGQTDIPGGLVGDAEFEHPGFAAGDHVQRLGDDGALDAAARDRAQERPVIVDHKVGASRPRRRPPGFDDGGQRHTVAGLLPVFGGLQNVFVAIEHGSLVRFSRSSCGADQA